MQLRLRNLQLFCLMLVFWAGFPLLALAQGLTLNITDTGYDPIPAGGTIRYVVRIDNSDNTPSAATAITFDVPADTEFTGLTGDLPNCTPAPLAGPGVVSCDIPAMAPQGTLNAVFDLVPSEKGTTQLAAQIDGGPSGVQTTTVSLGADLGVTLTGDAARTAGEIAQFTATVHNHGPYSSDGATLTLTLPTGLSRDVVLPAGCEIAGGVISCAVSGPIAVGDEVSFPFSTQITAEDASTITVAAALQDAGPDDPINDNDNAAHDIAVAAGTDVSIGKERSPAGLLLIGDEVEFTLSPRYAGTPPTEATITEVLPPEYEYVLPVQAGPGWTCPAPTGQTLTCTYAGSTAQAANYTAPIVISAKAIAAGDAIVNTATIAAPGDVIPGNNSGSDSPAYIQEPEVDLVALKSGPPRSLVTVGNIYGFELRTRNDGNAPFHGPLTFTDHLPAGMVAQSVNAPAGWICASIPAVGPADILCETAKYTPANPLLPGQESDGVTLEIEITEEGTLSNGLTVSSSDYNYPDRDLGNNTISTGVESGAGPRVADLRVTKGLADPGPFVSGTLATFEIEVINDGPADAVEVVLDDRLNDIVFASPTDEGASISTILGVADNLSCEVGGDSGFDRDVQCRIDTLPQCQAGVDCPRIMIEALVGDAGSKVNSASAYSLRTPDPDTGNNSASVPYNVTPMTDVSVTKASAIADGGQVRAGLQLDYVITAKVTRDGRSGAEHVTITDTLPRGVRFVSAVPSAGICTTAPAAGAIIDAGNDQLICDLGAIGNGSQQTVRVAVIPTTQQAVDQVTIINSVAVATSTPEFDSSNNSAQISHEVSPPMLDLLINKSDGPDPVEINSNTVYTIKATNNGPSDAFNVTLRDTLPVQGMSYETHTAPAGATCVVSGVAPDVPGGTIACDIPHLAAGESAELTVEMKALMRGRWTNKAEIESDETRAGYETQIANNRVEEDTTVRVRSDLQVVKTATPSEVALWEDFAWTVRVESLTGAGLDLSEDVTFEDTLPANMVLTGAPAATAGSCTGTAGGREIACNLGDIAAGSFVDVTIPARVLSVTQDAQVFENTATAATKSFDANPGNNSSSATVTVRITSLSGSIWRDFNDDGTRDGHDSGIANVRVVATRLAGPTDDPFSSEVSTDANGDYAFTLLPPGTYTISYIPAAGMDTGRAIPGDQGGVSGGVTAIEGIVLDLAAPGAEYDFTQIPQPAVALTKTAATPVLQSDGSFRITYGFRLQNNSQEPIEDVALFDHVDAAFGTFVGADPAPGQFSVDTPALPGIFDYNPAFDGAAVDLLASGGTLAAGAFVDIPVTFHVNPALPRERDSLVLNNSARMESTGAYSGRDLDAVSDASTTLEFSPDVVLEKRATPVLAGAAAVPGDRIDFAFTVRNTGKTPLLDLTIDDGMADLVWDRQGPIARLDPGEIDETSFAAHYILTQADIDRGGIENTASVRGQWGIAGGTPSTVQDSDTAEITTLAAPGLTVDKVRVSDTIGNPRTEVGETIRYGFTVTNSGNVNLRDVELRDVLPGILPDPAGAFSIGDMPVGGAPVTVYADYAVTQADIDAGEVRNTATASGEYGPGNTPTSADSNTVVVELYREAGVTLTKVVDETGLNPVPIAGDEITWTIIVGNTGNVTLQDLVVSDPKPGATVQGSPLASLAPGAVSTGEITVRYRLTQADINAGEIENQARLAVTPPGGPAIDVPSGNDPGNPNEDPTQWPLAQAPSIALVKAVTSDLSGPLQRGDKVSYSFTIRNTGNVPLGSLALSDDLPGVVLNDGALAGRVLEPAEEVVVTGEYTLTAADIDAGTLSNTAEVTGNSTAGAQEPVNDISGTDFDNDDPTTATLVREPAIALVKTVDLANSELSSPIRAGDRLHYAFEVHNTGNVTLTDIDVSDLVGGVTLSGARSAPLAAGERDSTSFTAIYTLTQADIDAGRFANRAEVIGTGNGPGGPETVTDQSGTAVDRDEDTVFDIAPSPALSVVKTAHTGALSVPPAAGEIITYEFVITNTGNVSLMDVELSDALPGIDIPVTTIALLAPGEIETLTASYPVQQRDIEAGQVENRASVEAVFTDPVTNVPTPVPPVESDLIIVPLTQDPGIAVVKSAASAISDPAALGEQITYTFTVTNTGNVTLEAVTLNDPLDGIAPSSFVLGTMAPGAVETHTASYAITQDDIDRGRVTNQATVTGTFDDGTGPKTYSDLSGPSNDEDEETVVPVGQAPGIALVKTADATAVTDPAAVGQKIEYSFAVANTGNVTLRDVLIADPLTGLAPSSFAVPVLVPGQTVTVGPALYVLRQADITAQQVENRAEATGTYGPPGEERQVSSPSKTDTGLDEPTRVSLAARPAIALLKWIDPAVDPATLRLGDVIEYGFTVINTGNVPLGNITLSDELEGIELAGTITGELMPGERDDSSLTATYTVTQADIDAGQVVNRARVTGRFDDGSSQPPEVSDISGLTPEDDDPTVVPLVQRGAIALIKTSETGAMSSPAQAGDEIRYNFAITNTGEVTLSNVTLEDSMLGAGLQGSPIASLAPGQTDSTSYGGLYRLTQADIDAGRIENQARVTGEYGDDGTGNPVEVSDLSGADNDSDTPDVIDIDQVPGIALIKSADASNVGVPAEPGEVITYAFTVTNTGNVTLRDVTLSDALDGIVLSGGPIAELAPGMVDATTFTASYALTQADIIVTHVTNTAEVTGSYGPAGGPQQVVQDRSGTANDNDEATRVDLGYPELGFEITVADLVDRDGDGIIGLGDEVLFRFTVTNTGTVPLYEVNIDSGTLTLPFAGLICQPVTLEIAESAHLNCTGAAHVVRAQDISTGQITLEGDARGESSAGVVVTASSSAPAVLVQRGGLTLEKLAGIGTALVGDTVPYSIRIANDAQGVPVTVRLTDTLPEGFVFRAGSARLDGGAVEPVVTGRMVMLEPVTLQPGQDRILTMDVFVSSSVRPGLHTNRVRMISPLTGQIIAPEASATVRIEGDAMLQCSTVLGRVFDDRDQDGHMTEDRGEEGLPNVRLITPDGIAIHTDEHGRFSVPCAALPREIGGNFMLRLDERTLPSGYRVTTENPRVVRVTPGMITRLDFGATLSRLIRIDLAANAFAGEAMGPALEQGLRQLVAEVYDTPAMLRITYQQTAGEAAGLARQRIAAVEAALRRLWPANGRYQLNIETTIQRVRASE